MLLANNTRRLLASSPHPDGIFCFNDETATGALRAVMEAGLKIPQDVAIIGVGNMTNTDFLKIPLTTIDQNSGQIGKTAALIALDLMAAPSPVNEPRSETVPVQLIERASTARSS